ncbi:MAG TPA: branched-chain amino acid ABC transporter permease/ATP-binding protein [Acidimicrobiales bacterium]|nr:branched-chain amino acid ABC transporter permease/ATP-binding protein [Acidimicrobiales bacterium]
MSAGLVLGFVTGLTYGLLAVGIVLVYKTNRFLNLAHAQFGALSALLVAKFVLDWGWSWWAAFPAAIAVGVAVGLLVERLIIRKMVRQKRSGTSMLLVSIGVAELLLALNYVPALGPNVSRLNFKGYPLPFSTKWVAGSVVLGGEHILIIILAPVIVAGLALFLKYSVWGKAIRACAANAEAARLCGIPLMKVNALAWGVAGGLSAVTAVLVAPSQGSFNGVSLGPDLLLRALGAAALGGFTSIPAALIGGLLIGEVEQVTLSLAHSSGPAELVVFLLVVAIVAVRGRVIGETATETGSGDEEGPVPVPVSIKDRVIVRHQRAFLGLGGLFVAVLLPKLPYFRTEAHRFDMVVILVMAVASVALTLVVGWAGQVSLGHYALLGLGAYLTAKLVPHGLSLPLVLFLAGLAGAAAMVVVGLPALRIKGLALAVTTLGFAVVAPTWLFDQSWLGAPGNAPVIVQRAGLATVGVVRSQLGLYYVALALLAVTLVCLGSVRRSLPGQLVVAVRDNEKAVAGFGVQPAAVKLGILALSGAIVAAAGVVWGLAWQSMSTDLVPAQLSLVLLALPVIGGLGSLSGAVAGALAIYVPSFFISPYLTSVFGSFGRQVGFQLALGGLGLVLIPLTQPSGLAGIGRKLWQKVLHSVAGAVERAEPDAFRPPLAVRGVSKRFGSLTALDDVNLEVAAGEIVGLIGPNGAGKTTLMDVISGQLSPDAGTVALFGRPVTALSPDQRAHLGLGRNFQEARLFPGLTTREALRVALARGHRVSLLSALVGAPWAAMSEARARRRVHEVIEAMGLGAWADTLTGELSTGTRRICELAAQIVAGPRVLLLDEPTAGVAQREAEAFGPLLRRIRDQLDCSILIVEHDMPLLMGVCDRIYALASGTVLANGTPEEVRDDPQVITSYLGTDGVAAERSGRRTAASKTSGASGPTTKVTTPSITQRA